MVEKIIKCPTSNLLYVICYCGGVKRGEATGEEGEGAAMMEWRCQSVRGIRMVVREGGAGDKDETNERYLLTLP